MRTRSLGRGMMRPSVVAAGALAAVVALLASCAVRSTRVARDAPVTITRSVPPLVGVWIGADDSAWTLRADGTFGAVLPSGETRRGRWWSAGDGLTLAPRGLPARRVWTRWRVS